MVCYSWQLVAASVRFKVLWVFIRSSAQLSSPKSKQDWFNLVCHWLHVIALIKRLFYAGHKDLTITRNCAWKASGTQSMLVLSENHLYLLKVLVLMSTSKFSLHKNTHSQQEILMFLPFICRCQKLANKESMQQCWDPSIQPWENSKRGRGQHKCQLNPNT